MARLMTFARSSSFLIAGAVLALRAASRLSDHRNAEALRASPAHYPAVADQLVRSRRAEQRFRRLPPRSLPFAFRDTFVTVTGPSREPRPLLC